MKILILGGTRFLGRAIVKEALKRKHEITLFNRGTNKEVFPDLEQLVGNRDQDVSLLKKRNWDAVIDTCAFAPHQIKNIAAVLRDNVEHYSFISSISVYRDWIPPNITEEYHLQSIQSDKLKEVEVGTVSPYEYYGALKALCEAEVEKNWPGHALHIRAGLLVGPYDYSDRLPYWVERVAQGGRILVPGRLDRPIQLIDVKDIASWVIHMAENRNAGVYNVTGPNNQLTIEELLNMCRAVTGSDGEWVSVDEPFLRAHKIEPWTEMPLWIPEDFSLEGEKAPWKGTFTISIDKAVRTGLSFRPLKETIQEVYHWERERHHSDKVAGLSRDKECALLNEWDK